MVIRDALKTLQKEGNTARNLHHTNSMGQAIVKFSTLKSWRTIERRITLSSSLQNRLKSTSRTARCTRDCTRFITKRRQTYLARFLIDQSYIQEHLWLYTRRMLLARLMRRISAYWKQLSLSNLRLSLPNLSWMTMRRIRYSTSKDGRSWAHLTQLKAWWAVKTSWWVMSKVDYPSWSTTALSSALESQTQKSSQSLPPETKTSSYSEVNSTKAAHQT